jgi:hypothetical protein
MDPRSGHPLPGKRKKKKKNNAQGPNPAHIALAVGAICVVGLLTFLAIKAFKSAKTKETYDPKEVVAELKKANAVVEEEDGPSGKTVVGIMLNTPEIPKGILQKLGAFPQLRKLDLTFTNMSDVQLEHLEDLTSLRSLSLSHTKVTGGGMQFLKKLTNLEDLNLDSTLVDDDHLEELSGLRNLKRLHISNTFAHGQGLKAAIPDLEVMD